MASISGSNFYPVNKGIDLPPDLRNIPREDWQKTIDAWNKKQIEIQAKLPKAVISAPNANLRAGVDFQAPPRRKVRDPKEAARRISARKAKEAAMAFEVATLPFMGLKSAAKGIYGVGKQIYKHGDKTMGLISRLLKSVKGKPRTGLEDKTPDTEKMRKWKEKQRAYQKEQAEKRAAKRER